MLYTHYWYAWCVGHAAGCLPPAVTVLQVMENDVVAAVKAGAHGVVIGVGAI